MIYTGNATLNLYSDFVNICDDFVNRLTIDIFLRHFSPIAGNPGKDSCEETLATPIA